MDHSADLYLGAFLIVCGFTLSLLNLRRLVKDFGSSLPAVLISENLLLMCIGIAFVSRSIYEISPVTTEMQDIEKRIADMDMKEELHCNFYAILKSYGPLIISLVNSFLTLIIDNYMHYKMLADVKKEDEENTVQEFSFRSGIGAVSKLFTCGKKYFSFLAIALQWIVPIVIALSMYPIEIKERQVSLDQARTTDNACMAMIAASNETCTMPNFDANYSLELRQFIPPKFIEASEHLLNGSAATEIDAVINNVYKIIANMKNATISSVNVTSAPLWRQGKKDHTCMTVCYMENKSLIVYMFVIAIVSYFVPITISTVILTKIHTMELKRPGLKTYVSRELLYNILFWTPVMFDTFLSLLLCSYSMNGVRTSIFNVIANIYQAVKNFMNTKYFQENSIMPIE